MLGESGYRPGQRIEYRNGVNQKKNGVIKSVQGSGMNARYTVQGDDGQTETIMHLQVNRGLA